MTILHTSDLHFNQDWFDWIAKEQNNYDIFVISGDFLDSSRDISLVEQIKWVTNWIKEFQKPLFVCSGNHDIEEYDNEEWLNRIDNNNYYPDNSKKSIDGTRFGCYPFIGGDGYYDFDDVDILVVHTPPSQCSVSIDKESQVDWGDRELYNALSNKIIKPKIILCGHQHNPTKRESILKKTKIYNSACKDSDIVPHFLILRILGSQS